MPAVVLDPILLRNFAIALFLGALVGIDREHRAAETPTFGGLRTFMLIALAGGLASWLGAVLATVWLPAVGLGGLCVLLAVSYYVNAAGQREAPGLTSEVAAVVVYLLGVACVAGQPEVAVGVGITASVLLAFKSTLHDAVRRIGRVDLEAGLKLLFSTFVVLPLLPDEPVGPLGVLNPYRLWLLVVLISGLSLLGYAAVRVIGPERGMALTGLFGGLVSSTAVTLSAARQSRTLTALERPLAVSVLVAWSTMFARVILEVALVNARLVPVLAPAMGAMALAGLVGALVIGLRTRADGGAAPVELRNPFSLWEAVRFGLLFAGILVVVELARRYLDPRAQYAIAALAGTTDVDAITLSMADLARDQLDPHVAVRAIFVAAVTNTLVKLGLTAGLGSRGLARRVGVVTAAILACGAVGLLLG